MGRTGLVLSLNPVDNMQKENLIKFYSDFKIYIFPAVVVISGLFLTIFAIYPQTAKLISNQQSADGLINKSQFLETKVAALGSFNKADLSQKVRAALVVFPADKDFGNIFSLLQKIAMESGFNITSISLGNAGGKLGNTESYEVRLDIRGDKTLMPVLLGNLERSPRLIIINNIDVSANQARQTDISLIIGVLYSQFPRNLGTIDSPLPEITQEDENLLAKLSRAVIQTSGSIDSVPKGKANPFE